MKMTSAIRFHNSQTIIEKNRSELSNDRATDQLRYFQAAQWGDVYFDCIEYTLPNQKS